MNYKEFKKRLISSQQKFGSIELNYTDFIKNFKKKSISSSR